jgi:hypothetical protein
MQLLLFDLVEVSPLHVVRLWVADALPDIPNLILVLVGVIMSLPKLAEKIESYKITRYEVSIGCIVLGLWGFVISVNQEAPIDLSDGNIGR